MRSEFQSIPLEVEPLRTHINELIVAGQNVGKTDGHVEDLNSILKVLPGIRFAIVE